MRDSDGEENRGVELHVALPAPIQHVAFTNKTLNRVSYRKTSVPVMLRSSVADPGCLSRIPDPDFYPFPIPDLGSRISDPGSKNSNKRER